MTTKYFTRKLTSLEYPDADKFDVSDVDQYRFVVVWLENRFICHYNVEERADLNNTENPEWNLYFDKYLNDLGVPFKSDDPNASLDWILCLAVQNRFSDNDKDKKYSEITGLEFSKSLQANKLSSSLDTIDFNSDEFKTGVYSIASILGIPHHPDHIRVLKACCIVIEDKLSQANIDKAGAEEGKLKIDYMNIDEIANGMHTSNSLDMKRITAVLRLIHMNKMRKMQMDINSILVQIQEIIADPKTNEKLGKVGF